MHEADEEEDYRGGVQEKGKEQWSPHCSFFNFSQNTNTIALNLPEKNQLYLEL